MKILMSCALFGILTLSPWSMGAQKIDGLYVNTYDNHSDPALIFVHGGPGYDSQDFEWTTAATLATKGYFVVVYDERGQGRSDIATSPSIYSYKQYADDIKLIIDQLNLHNPVLIGHSHGGPISLKFDQAYPGVAAKIVLVSGPIDDFRLLGSMRTNCLARYAAIADSADADKLNAAFSTLNGTPSLQDEIFAVSDIFQLGLNKPCDLYTPSHPTAEAIALHTLSAQKHVPISDENRFFPMGNFVVNEQYIHVDQTQWVTANANHIFGIYGSEDGLFTQDVLASIQADLAANASPFKFQLIDGASHAIYIDQQDKFINALMNILK